MKKVLFNVTDTALSYMVDELDQKNKTEPLKQNKINQVQCFPLYSILLAIGRTQIDFFSLDVEGAEYKILSTIPWHKVDMTVFYIIQLFNQYKFKVNSCIIGVDCGTE